MQITLWLLFKLVLAALLMIENVGDLKMAGEKAGLIDQVRDQREWRKLLEIPEDFMAEPSNSCFIPHASSLMNKHTFWKDLHCSGHYHGSCPRLESTQGLCLKVALASGKLDTGLGEWYLGTSSSIRSRCAEEQVSTTGKRFSKPCSLSLFQVRIQGIFIFLW